jgi:SAM-dependent methyltransferase
MDEHYARNYRDLYQNHWWWRARESLILSTLAALRPGGEWGRILDIGCGDGLFFDELSRLGHVEGIEPDPAGVTPGGRWAHRIHVRPFDESFRPERLYGLVLLLDVLEHFEDPKRHLQRALRLLEPGGTLLVTVPAFRLLWTSHDVLNHHRTRYTRARILELLREAGAEVVFARYFYRWAFPVKLAAHFKEALFPSTPTTPRVPPFWINRFLYGLSRAEQRTIGSWPLPFGSSLLAVARAPYRRQVSEASAP